MVELNEYELEEVSGGDGDINQPVDGTQLPDEL